MKVAGPNSFASLEESGGAISFLALAPCSSRSLEIPLPVQKEKKDWIDQILPRHGRRGSYDDSLLTNPWFQHEIGATVRATLEAGRRLVRTPCSAITR